MGLWKDNKFDPSATLFEDEEQLKICKNCGPLPLENFSDDGKYEKLCMNCEAESRSKKDSKYNRGERRKITNEIRWENQPWEKKQNNISGVFHLVPYDRPIWREHMELLFEPWMNWDNNGRGPGTWQIEHKIPKSFFAPHFKEPYDSCKQFQKCWCLENLRPLNSELNNAKTAKIFLPEGVTNKNILLECSLEEFKEYVKYHLTK